MIEEVGLLQKAGAPPPASLKVLAALPAPSSGENHNSGLLMVHESATLVELTHTYK